MPTIQGNPRSFYKKFSFVIEIDGFLHAGFQKCSELSAEVAKVEHFEGGALIPNKSPGRVTFADITLERGATNDLEFYSWFTEVVASDSGQGLPDEEYKRDLDIVQLDRDGTELRRWHVVKAWPTKHVAGDWDNTTDDTQITSLTLTFDYYIPEA